MSRHIDTEIKGYDINISKNENTYLIARQVNSDRWDFLTKKGAWKNIGLKIEKNIPSLAAYENYEKAVEFVWDNYTSKGDGSVSAVQVFMSRNLQMEFIKPLNEVTESSV